MNHKEAVIAVEKVFHEATHGAHPDLPDLNNPLKSLGYDSLDTVEMVMLLEDQCGVEIPKEYMLSIRTLGDVTQWLEKHA